MARSKASFRDPAGFIFVRDGQLFRQINLCAEADYECLIQSGLYDRLCVEGKLVPHEEKAIAPESDRGVYKVIKPERIPFISYPYEWTFPQLKNAALLTLEIQQTALEYGMSLKDTSAYNIQFIGSRPIFIDTLSFEKYKKGSPWIAYRQFCQHFLAPLALAGLNDLRYLGFLRENIDGFALDFVCRQLPLKSWFNPGLLMHLHIHSRGRKAFCGRSNEKSARLSKHSLVGLLDSLRRCVSGLKGFAVETDWSNYYGIHNYSSRAMEEKKRFIRELTADINPGCVWDLGANDGTFSSLISERAEYVVSFDMDYAAVEKNYISCRDSGSENILSLVMDFSNPSPSTGWANSERMSLLHRAPADTVLALALVHHLAITNNLPFSEIAEFMAEICRKYLVIEFIPKRDFQIQQMLSGRKDIFVYYSETDFERELSLFFLIEKKHKLADSERTLYLMKKK